MTNGSAGPGSLGPAGRRIAKHRGGHRGNRYTPRSCRRRTSPVTTGLVDPFSTPTCEKLLDGHHLDANAVATRQFHLDESDLASDEFSQAAHTAALNVCSAVVDRHDH